MDVSEAIARRISIRAFRPDPVPGEVVAEILARAAQAPSGGNLQPWRVYGLAGEPLAEFKALVAANPFGEDPEYDVYPPNLWEPFRTRRFQNGEDLYATIGIPREDRPARLRQLAKNGEFFGALSLRIFKMSCSKASSIASGNFIPASENSFTPLS